jgi:WD40 repeat protein
MVGAALVACAAAPFNQPTAGGVVPRHATEGAEPADEEQSTPSGELPVRIGRMNIAFERRAFWRGSADRRKIKSEPQRYEDWRLLRTINVAQSHLFLADISRDQRFLIAASSSEAKLRLYDVASGKLRGAHAVPGYEPFGRGDFVLWPGATPLAAFGGDTGIDLIDAVSGKVLERLAKESVWELRLSDDERVLGASHAKIPEQTSTLTFYQLAGRKLELALRLEFSERVDDWDLSSDKRVLALTYYPSNDIELIDLSSRSILWTIPGPQNGASVDISADDGRVVVGGATLLLADVEGERLAGFGKFGNNIDHVRFSPSGDAIAASSYDGHVRIVSAQFDTPELSLRKDLRHGEGANVYAVEFTEDGKRLVSSSGDQTIRVWGR